MRPLGFKWNSGRLCTNSLASYCYRYVSSLVIRRSVLDNQSRCLFAQTLAFLQRNISVISSKYNPVADKNEDEVRKCIANVPFPTCQLTHTFTHALIHEGKRSCNK